MKLSKLETFLNKKLSDAICRLTENKEKIRKSLLSSNNLSADMAENIGQVASIEQQIEKLSDLKWKINNWSRSDEHWLDTLDDDARTYAHKGASKASQWLIGVNGGGFEERSLGHREGFNQLGQYLSALLTQAQEIA